MVDDYRPTHFLGLCMPSDAQQLYGTATLHSFPLLRHALPLCFVLCLSALPPSNPSAFVFCSPQGIPLSFCISLSPSVSLHPVSFSSSPPPAPFVSRSNPPFIYSPRFISCLKKCLCVCVCVFLSRCSGPTDSTSLITRARAALSSSSRPKSWKRSGWSSLAWPCECVLSASVWLHAWQCDKSVSFCLSCILSQHQRAQFARPVIQVRLLEDLWGPGDKRMSRLEVGLLKKLDLVWKKH